MSSRLEVNLWSLLGSAAVHRNVLLAKAVLA
jgi:hypothetical protein